jgi:Na+-driven multidrug efflux pump
LSTLLPKYQKKYNLTKFQKIKKKNLKRMMRYNQSIALNFQSTNIAIFFTIVPCSSSGQAILSICTITVNAAAFEDSLVGLVSSGDSHGAGDGGNSCK